MASSRKYRVQLFQDTNGSWRYRLRAPNGQIMQSGESYVTLANAQRAAERFAALLAVPSVVEMLKVKV